jgi:hypothetical protein
VQIPEKGAKKGHSEKRGTPKKGQGKKPADGIHSNRRVEQQDSPGKWVEQT